MRRTIYRGQLRFIEPNRKKQQSKLVTELFFKNNSEVL